MSVKWKSPLLDWEERNQDPNLAFTLVARNEAGRQMWADPRNISRYAPASFTRQGTRDPSLGPIVSEQPDPDSRDEQPRRKKTKDTEPALQFLFNNWPKNFAKGFVLGSSDKLCDALLGDGEGCISEHTLAFTFNIQHELIMEVVSDDLTWVKYKGQKGAVLGRFTWIFPRGQEPIRIQVAGVIEFDVVLPEYGINKGGFYENCRSFLSSAAVADLLPDSLQADSTVLTRQASGISGPQKSFYLRGKVLGSGAYGEVHKALRMPDGKFYAAKRFKDMDSFSQEADMLKKVCKNYHKNIVQFVEEWQGDYKPLLIMEYVAGGNLSQQISTGMEFGKIANLANQILSALVFLHDQGVLHRDIKPANILCVTPDHYKLADFGVSKEVAPSLSRQGTTEYMAPEVFDLAPYSFTADIWSLGVVLLECMAGLPDGHPGNGRKWYKELFAILLAYHRQCVQILAEGDALDIIRFVKTALLQLKPDKRLSARKCLEDYQELLQRLAHNIDLDAGSGANTPTQAHPHGSFRPNSLEASEDNDAGEETSRTAQSNDGGTPEEGREYRNEDRPTMTSFDKARDLLLGSLASPTPSIGERKLHDSRSFPFTPASIVEERIYDPANVIPWPTSSAKGVLYDPGRVISSIPSTSSVSDASTKSRRDSDASAKDVEDDGSVTPRRRAPYHPGNEAASPGLGYGLDYHPPRRMGES